MKILHYFAIFALFGFVAPATAQDKKGDAEPQTEKSAEVTKDQKEEPDEKEADKKEASKPQEKAEKESKDKADDKKAEGKKDKSEKDAKETKEETSKEAKKEEPEAPPLGSDAEPGTDARIVCQDLNNPCGVAIQPGTGAIFVADSGNFRVVDVDQEEGKAFVVVKDFPKDVYGKGPKVNIGPLGLLFLDENTLVVGGGGHPDGTELLRVYEILNDGEAIKADKQKSSFSLAETDDVKGEGNFYAMAATQDGLFVTCNGDDTKGWVARASLDGTTLSDFTRYLATKEATEVDAPVAITISPVGELVVGQMGEITVPGDSLITFYDANDKTMLLNLETGLHDISAIAYSPRGQLYVLDYSWADPSQGGLFQILDDETSESGMRTKKIMSLDKPTAMAFDADGSLFVTQLGVAEDGSSKGQLIHIEKDAGF